MKKVVIVSYQFPPSGGKAVQRAVKLVKYLPAFGWQPFVFARKTGEGRQTLVHLVNLPESDHIIQRHEEPPTKPGLRVAVSLAPGTEVSRCWATSPHPQPHALERSWESDAEGRAVCLVPDLQSMVSLVIESVPGT